MILGGLDRLLGREQDHALPAYGLLSHAASVTRALEPIVAALTAAWTGPPQRLFGPEHGFWAVEQDMVAAAGGRDPFFGIETRSLYGSSVASLRPSEEAFEGLELLLIDLQDVGARYYTYAATAVWAAQVALSAGLEVWVLDRPNPLGGLVVEGNLRREGFESFVGAFAMPVRHGLSLGEICLLEARRGGWQTPALRIFEVEGWHRQAPTAADGWCWRSPSPNMPTLETAWLYPGSCLLEATELSEGRGTTRPFQLVGAPGLDGGELARAMNERGLEGVRYLPTLFRPQFQKHAGELCGGVEIVVTDAAAFASLRAGVELLRAIVELDREALQWRSQPYEFVADRPAIDLLAGSAALRLALDGEGDVDAWMASWADDEQAFCAERDEVLLYR
jgi:uncharacterized protein YbbC (DUF1343 family)